MAGGEKLVYFMRPVGMAGPIKIGCSTWPENRLKSLDIWSPFPLEIIASAPGSNDSERALHWKFRDNRSHGEWFSASSELLAFIAAVRLSGSLPPLEAPPQNARKGSRSGINALPRDPTWKKAKADFTRQLRKAERHAFGYGSFWNRPEWVKEAIKTWQGAFVPPPSGEVRERLEQYCFELLSRPKDTRTWREYFQQRQARAA